MPGQIIPGFAPPPVHPGDLLPDIGRILGQLGSSRGTIVGWPHNGNQTPSNRGETAYSQAQAPGHYGPPDPNFGVPGIGPFVSRLAGGPVGNGLANLFTLGEHDNPGTLRQYASQVASSFDPRHPANWVNLASVLVPGNRRGGATIPQQEFLNAIRSSSYGRAERAARFTGVVKRPVYEPGDPLVQALAQKIGGLANMNREGARGTFRNPVTGAAFQPAPNPWVGLTQGGTMFNPRARLGLSPGEAAHLSRPVAPAGDVAGHSGWLDQMMIRNAIQRRN